MRQAVHVRSLVLLFIAALLAAPTARAQDRPDAGSISTQPFPGSLTAARAAVGDTRQADAGQFLVDLIRRSFQIPLGTRGLRREAVVRPLLEQLQSAPTAGAGTPADVWPLPLTPAVWTESILADRGAPGPLLASILRSSSGSLMYCALLSLDDETRQWFASQPALLQHIAQRRAAAFLIAAPGIRVRDAALQVPGGAAAIPTWEAAVGKRVSEPTEFIRALVGAAGAGLPYFFGGAAQLGPAQIRVLLNLTERDEAVRASAARRLLPLFERIALGWDVEERPFWRPTLDPFLLVSDLRLNAEGAPVLPGTTGFWTAAFSGAGAERASLKGDAASTLVSGSPADFIWICEQVFVGGPAVTRSPYYLVLLASRRIPSVTASNAVPALALLHGSLQFPALIGTLERARVEQLTIYAEAAARARQLTAIDDGGRARVALAQFQGALSLIARAAAQGSLNTTEASRLISSLSAVAPDAHGEYRGKLVEWVSATVSSIADARGASADGRSAADLDGALLRWVSGDSADLGPVDWEGTRYRLDFAAAEATRVRRLLGEHVPPYMSGAGTLVAAAQALESAAVVKAGLAEHAGAVEKAVAAVNCWNKGDDAWPMLGITGRCHDIADALTRTARSGDARDAARLTLRLRQLSDVLLGRGLLVLAYAAALGHADSAVVSPEDAASRHDFGFAVPGFGRAGAWRWPASGSDRIRNWHVTGSALGLDTTLAQFTLVRTSTRPPSLRPSITEEDRAILTRSAALMHPGVLTGDDHRTIVAAMRRGRERLAAVRSREEAAAIGDDLGLAPLARTLLAWNASFDARRAVDVLSPSQVFLLGLDNAVEPARFDQWGVSGEPRTGCQCLQFPVGRAGDHFVGRWFSGVLATGFTDLNLRIAELLDQVRMPGALLAPVLAAATWDFAMGVVMRDFDDLLGWSDYANALDIERVEQYLALLTTDGPLVPVTEGSSPR